MLKLPANSPKSRKYKASKDWDEIQKEPKNIDFSDEYLSKTKFSKAFNNTHRVKCFTQFSIYKNFFKYKVGCF